jgi:hypothetical protein
MIAPTTHALFRLIEKIYSTPQEYMEDEINSLADFSRIEPNH